MKTVKITVMLIALCAVAVTSFAQRPDTVRKLVSYTEIGALYGSSDNEDRSPFTFHSSLNYAFHRNLSAGIGAGAEFLKETYLPVTANVLYRFGKKQISPFVRLQAGYQIPLENKTDMPYTVWHSFISYYPSPVRLDSRGGFMVNPSAGVTVYTRAGLGISFSAGYRYQQLTYKHDSDYTLHAEYSRLSLTLGIIF